MHAFAFNAHFARSLSIQQTIKRNKEYKVAQGSIH